MDRYQRLCDQHTLRKKRLAIAKKRMDIIVAPLSPELQGAGNEGIVAGFKGKDTLQVFDPVQLSFYFCARFKQGGDVVVGDHILIKDNILERVLPRRNVLSRLRGDTSRQSDFTKHTHKLAANLDIVIIVASLNNPQFHSRFIDRYLVLCHESEIQPVLCLTKCDLTDERDETISWYRDHLNLPIVETSTISGKGLDALREIIKGKTIAFVGNSGVGKSSLVNTLCPGMDAKVNAVNRHGKGRHTTTTSSLYALADNTFIIDTPGIRSLSLDNFSPKYLKFYFKEFDGMPCKYKDCLHDKEPHCAVKDAVENNVISLNRYESYLKILNSLKE